MKIIRTRAPLGADVLAEAAACIRAGGTLIFPTDTVYGLGCSPHSEAAIAHIFAAKRRPADKPLAIHLASPDDARRFAQVTDTARIVMDCLWPGPVAIVVPRKPRMCEAAARREPSISLRCPASEECAALLRATGALAATSANISGRDAFTGRDEDIASLPDATLAIITGPTAQGRESTVLDCRSASVRILREGAIAKSAIVEALQTTGISVE